MYSFLFVFADKSAVVCAASKADTGDAVTSTAFSVVLKSIIVSLLLDSSTLFLLPIQILMMALLFMLL